MSTARLPTTADRMPRVARADAVRVEPLRAWAPVSLRAQACLTLRRRGWNCRACADACPLAALAVADQRVELVGDCSGCGRCQAACPMGALSVADFDREPALARAHAGELVVDCERAAAAFDRSAAALRVPCLGGLSAGRLLALCADRPEHTVVLANRGECARCDNGGGVEHVATATVQRVAAWLREAGVPETLRPRIGRLRGAGRGARSAGGRQPTAGPIDPRGRARRGWFTALARPAPTASPHAGSLTQLAPSTERQQQLDALQRLAARYGGALPAALFHRVDIGRSCRGHRVCASSCPTGALVRYRDHDHARIGVTLDATLCVACGHCAAACPEHAITLQRGVGLGSAGAARRPLNAFVPRECADCGARFALGDAGGETRCPRCRASARLARSAFQSLFGARPGPQGSRWGESKEELR